jgi:CheY-like chemotaxis protein
LTFLKIQIEFYVWGSIMAKESLAAWYFPTTVVFIDDSAQFLKNLLLNVDTRQITPKLINNSLKASQFLRALPPESLILKRLASVKFKSHEESYINEILHSLHKDLEKSDRFDEVSVIVIDYAMPGFNGIEICSQLRTMNSQLKILMLTAEASEHLAIKAFNEGLIDKFMRKDYTDFLPTLNGEIQTLQKACFQKISSLILNRLDADSESSIAVCLQDPAFISLFQDICKKNDITEYYLINNEGSFLLINSDGSPLLLAVKDEQMMSDAYQIALHADTHFPDTLLKAMKNYSQIMCLYDNYLCEDPDSAKKFLQPAEKLVGEKIYYYALVKNIEPYSLSKQKILSFKEHIDNLTVDRNLFTDI